MRYNRKPIEELDPRQLIYIKMHTENYGTEMLVINGKSYSERCGENRPTEEQIREALKGYENREAFLVNNKRGWAVVFKTHKNKTMYRWENLKKIN